MNKIKKLHRKIRQAQELVTLARSILLTADNQGIYNEALIDLANAERLRDKRLRKLEAMRQGGNHV